MTRDLSSETVESRRKQHDIFQLLKENCQLRILHPVKTTFWNEDKINILWEKKEAERIFQQTILKRMTKGISLKRKKIIKAGILKWSKVKKIKQIIKNMGKYNTFSFTF